MAASTAIRRDLRANPAAALLLWGALVSGKPDPELLRMIGVRELDLQTLESAYAAELLALRRIYGAGGLPLDAMAQMARGLVNTQLMQAEHLQTPRALADAIGLLARLPLWMRDRELDGLEREARREIALVRLEEARQRRAVNRAKADAPAPVPVAPAPVPVAPAPVPESVRAEHVRPAPESVGAGHAPRVPVEPAGRPAADPASFATSPALPGGATRPAADPVAPAWQQAPPPAELVDPVPTVKPAPVAAPKPPISVSKTGTKVKSAATGAVEVIPPAAPFQAPRKLSRAKRKEAILARS